MAPEPSGVEPLERPWDSPEEMDNPLTVLLAPRARAQILDSLLEAPDEPLTVSEITGQAGVDNATFHHHKDALTDLGIVETAGKKGNAQTYTLTDSPLVGLVAMLRNVVRDGVTPDLLDDRVVAPPAGQKLVSAFEVCPRCGGEYEELASGLNGVRCRECVDR